MISNLRYFPALDGLRGVAALMVLLHHVFIYFSLDHVPFLHDHMHLLVDLFYVISGFVVSHSFDPKMRGGMSFSRFALLRIVRLYPMFIAGMSLGAVTLLVFLLSQPSVSVFQIVRALFSNVFLIPTNALIEFKPFAFPANSSSWSLSFEIMLCAFYAALLVKCSYFLLCTLVAAAALVLLGVAVSAGTLDLGFYYRDYAFGAGRVLFPFLSGVALQRSNIVKPASNRWGYLSLPLLLLVLCNPVPATWLYDVVAVVLALPALVWLAASALPIAQLGRSVALSGKLSYPVYAIHFPVVVALSNASKILSFDKTANLMMSVVCLATVLPLAFLLHLYFDIPIRRRVTQWLDSSNRVETISPRVQDV